MPRYEDHHSLLPVVVVAGSYGHRDSVTAKTWDRILKELGEDVVEEGNSSGPRSGQTSRCACDAGRIARRLQASRSTGAVRPTSDIGSDEAQKIRDRPYHLVPIRMDLDELHSARELRATLHETLCTFDVVALLCCAGATQTNLILRAVGPLGMPTLITVASTVELPRMSEEDGVGTISPQFLRLISNNDQQAQAIVGTLQHLIQGSGPTRVRVIYESDADPYCTDLRRAIARQIVLLHPPSILLQHDVIGSVRRIEGGHVVYIGYHDRLAELSKLLVSSTNTHLILSDGCLADGAVAVRAMPSGLAVYGCAPATDPVQCGLDAFTAVSSVWAADAGEGATHFQNLMPHERLVAFGPRVKANLERGYANRYKFAAGENLRGGYVVQSVRDMAVPSPA